MDMMHSSAHNLAHQISTLLQMYKGADPNKWSMTDLNMLMTEVRFNLSHQIEATHAKVLNDMLPEIRVNKHLFRQLLHNLIENSIKYRKGKAPLIFIKAKEVEGGYEFHIEDNGIGVKDGKIFEIFSQQNTSSSGVGIGLALCRQIVERHDGKIWVDETYEDGTSICFFIPEKQMHNV
jgi:light-regulated signal transduction histidine kinase (bacteriophytochrome)